jgi:site-specific recombinase XerD
MKIKSIIVDDEKHGRENFNGGLSKSAPKSALNHCATHQPEHVVDIRFIQEWLGHESVLTTQRYNHVSEHVKTHNIKKIK